MKSNKLRHSKQTIIRKKAVEIHHNGADWFVGQYSKSENPYSTPFLYGRKKIDYYFKKEVNKLGKKAKILDVGCGTGDQVLELRKKGFDVVGVEPAKNMRMHAEKRLPKGIIKSGSLLKLPFPDKSFDFVYALEVFRYFDSEDNLKGLREVYRILKPKGVFFATFVNKNALDGFYILTNLRRFNEKVFGREMLCHTEFETPKKLYVKVKQTGFSSVSVHGAMLAGLRPIYVISRPAGEFLAKRLERLDDSVSDSNIFKGLSGHLIVIAKK
jgi:ubiquinone/menaquinone biosynthesis C-methylase UbiE